MPVVKSLAGLQPQLDQFIYHSAKWDRPEIQQQIQQVIKDQFGGPVENVTQSILKDIRDSIKPFDLD